MINVQTAAEALNGSQYRAEGSAELFSAMREARLVAVFGASDDLMEFRGAIDDELGAPGVAYITEDGLLTNDCDDEDCPYFSKVQDRTPEIEAKWCPVLDPGEPKWCWAYATLIPHSTFEVWEDGEPYCRGIVFSLDHLPLFGGR